MTRQIRRPAGRSGEAYAPAQEMLAALLATRVLIMVVAGAGVGLVAIPQAVDSLITR